LLPVKLEDVNKLVQGSFAAHLRLIKGLIDDLRSHYIATYVMIDDIDNYAMHRKKEVERLERVFES
jgi:hypothetical protein